MAEFVKVASTNDIAPGQGRLVTVKGRDIALFNVDGEFFALSQVICPLHGAKFDIRTGDVLGPPAYEAVTRYDVRVTGTDIEVAV